MKKNWIRKTMLAIFLMATAFYVYAVNTIWIIKEKQASITFELPAEGTKGKLDGLEASLDFNPLHPSESKITASVQVAGINTGNEMRDTHLKSADFFEVEKYPYIRFTSDSIVSEGSGFKAFGKLTIKEVVKAVEIPFNFEKSDSDFVFSGTLSLFSGDFGVGAKSAFGTDKVVVKITVPVIKQ